MGVTDRLRRLGRSLADEFEIAQSGVVRHGAGDARSLAQPGGVVPHPFSEADHVLDVEALPPRFPVPLRHESPRAHARCRDALLSARCGQSLG